MERDGNKRVFQERNELNRALVWLIKGQNETTFRYFLLNTKGLNIGQKTISRCCRFKMSYVFEPTYGENVGAGLGGRLSVGSPVHPRYVRHLTQSIQSEKKFIRKQI
jgi:hypothetical protein